MSDIGIKMLGFKSSCLHRVQYRRNKQFRFGAEVYARAGNTCSRCYWCYYSSAGWDTVQNQAYLTEMIQGFQRSGIRTSIFVDPSLDMIEGKKK
jgi:hypothetical protein